MFQPYSALTISRSPSRLTLDPNRSFVVMSSGTSLATSIQIPFCFSKMYALPVSFPLSSLLGAVIAARSPSIVTLEAKRSEASASEWTTMADSCRSLASEMAVREVVIASIRHRIGTGLYLSRTRVVASIPMFEA